MQQPRLRTPILLQKPAEGTDDSFFAAYSEAINTMHSKLPAFLKLLEFRSIGGAVCDAHASVTCTMGAFTDNPP